MDVTIDFKTTRTNASEDTTPEDRRANLEFLREGVVGVECVFVGTCTEALVKEFEQPGLTHIERILLILIQRCLPNEHIGTVEIYANGAINAYLKYKDIPTATGMFRCR